MTEEEMRLEDEETLRKVGEMMNFENLDNPTLYKDRFTGYSIEERLRSIIHDIYGTLSLSFVYYHDRGITDPESPNYDPKCVFSIDRAFNPIEVHTLYNDTIKDFNMNLSNLLELDYVEHFISNLDKTTLDFYNSYIESLS